MATKRINGARHAEQGVQIIELVYLRKNNTSAQRGVGGVHLTIVLVSVPGGQVFADHRAHGEYAADRLSGQRAAESAQAGMKAQLVANKRHQFARFNSLK